MASAGNVSKLSKCTPIESAVEKKAKTSHLSDSAVSGRLYHFRVAHRVIAVKKVDMA